MSISEKNADAPHEDFRVLVATSLVARILDNREKIFRYMYIAQLAAGLIFAGFGYYSGKDHFHLITKGVRTSGAIVAYKEEYMSSDGMGRRAFMPIVRFQAGDKIVQFKDWLGRNSDVPRNAPVIVLYDPADPSVAMIDRPVWNWIPWAPAFGLGLFLVLVAIKGWLRSLATPN
jgi:hypothetical protein